MLFSRLSANTAPMYTEYCTIDFSILPALLNTEGCTAGFPTLYLPALLSNQYKPTNVKCFEFQQKSNCTHGLGGQFDARQPVSPHPTILYTSTLASFLHNALRTLQLSCVSCISAAQLSQLNEGPPTGWYSKGDCDVPPCHQVWNFKWKHVKRIWKKRYSASQNSKIQSNFRYSPDLGPKFNVFPFWEASLNLLRKLNRASE